MSTNAPSNSVVIPVRLPRAEASRRLNAAVIRSREDAEAFNASGREGLPPIHVIKAEAGLGKSTAVLAEIREALRENPDMRILYAVPSLDLGEELKGKALDLGINARVMRGRSQPRPDGSGTMCAKSDIAETVAALSLSVTETLCRRKLDDGTVEECPFAASCAYLRQIADSKKGGLLIAAHQYLGVRLEVLKDIDWLIIDETFWATLTRRKRIDLGRFTSLRGVGTRFRGKKGESAKEFESRRQDAEAEICVAVDLFQRVTRTAEKDGRGIRLDDFRNEGLTAEHCRFLAGLEFSRLEKPEITPGMDYEIQKDAISRAVVSEAFGFARVWKILAAELETDRQGEPHGLIIRRGVMNPKSGALENVIEMFWSSDSRFKETPVLVIDADADAAIIDRFYPGATITEIAAEWRNVSLIQCHDRTGSAQALKGERRRDEVWNAALDMADRLSGLIADGDGRRPLLVTQKGVEDSYLEAGDLPPVGTPERERHPFDVAHFGALRGRDGWKSAAGIIIAGRIEPSPHELESLARSLFFADAEPLAFLDPGHDGRLCLPRHEMTVTAEDGSSHAVMVSYHPEPRADRILRQIREAELMQAIARARPIHRGADVPCEIIVLSNVPLPVRPTRLAAWAEIVPDRFDMMRLDGFMPDRSADVADAFPGLFASAAAVRQAASRRAARAFACDVSHNEVLYGECHSPSWVRVTFKRHGDKGNTRGAGWMKVRPGDTPERVALRVQRYLPDAVSIEAVMPLPSPEAAPMLPETVNFLLFHIVKREEMRPPVAPAGELPDAWWVFAKIRHREFVDRRRVC